MESNIAKPEAGERNATESDGEAAPSRPPSQRAKDILAQKARREERRKRGLCYDCGRPAVRSRCGGCWDRERRRRVAYIEARNARGICGRAGCPNANLPDKRYCQGEYDNLKKVKANCKRTRNIAGLRGHPTARAIRERESILLNLAKHGPAQPHILARRLASQPLCLGGTLNGMVERGEIVRRGNLYCARDDKNPEKLSPKPVSSAPINSSRNSIA